MLFRCCHRFKRSTSVQTSTIVHDLRSPAHTIISLSEMLREDMENKRYDSASQRVNQIIQLGKMFSLMTENLLHSSKISSGTMSINRERIHLKELLTDIKEMHEFCCNENGNTFTIDDTTGDNFELFTDKAQLLRVINNLISNATKHTQNGNIILALSLEKNGFTIKVSDTGEGIPPKDLATIFEKFSQVSSSSARKKGTGLGLFVVKEITNSLNGEVSVESALQKGSTFTITLPVRQQERRQYYFRRFAGLLIEDFVTKEGLSTFVYEVWEKIIRTLCNTTNNIGKTFQNLFEHHSLSLTEVLQKNAQLVCDAVQHIVSEVTGTTNKIETELRSVLGDTTSQKFCNFLSGQNGDDLEASICHKLQGLEVRR